MPKVIRPTNASQFSVFVDIQEASHHAAEQVSHFWLSSAARIIARGECPAKLSACGLELARSEMDRPIYARYHGLTSRWFNGPAIAASALMLSLSKLHAGLFPEVKAHFLKPVSK